VALQGATFFVPFYLIPLPLLPSVYLIPLPLLPGDKGSKNLIIIKLMVMSGLARID